jgi:hypothetical protein
VTQVWHDSDGKLACRLSGGSGAQSVVSAVKG